MSKFFNLVFKETHSDEVLDYLATLIEEYNLNTYEIQHNICMYDSVIMAVLREFMGEIIPFYYPFVDEIDFNFENNQIISNLTLDDLLITIGYNEDINSENVKIGLEKFNNIIEDINVLLNTFG